MKVKEMIRELANYNLEADVYVDDGKEAYKDIFFGFGCAEGATKEEADFVSIRGDNVPKEECKS